MASLERASGITAEPTEPTELDQVIESIIGRSEGGSSKDCNK